MAVARPHRRLDVAALTPARLATVSDRTPAQA